MIPKQFILTLLIAYAEARFGQEQVPIDAIAQVQGGDAGAAATIAGAAISDLLGGADACAKLATADQIVAELGGGADAIAAAIGMVTAEKNTNPFANDNAQVVCGDPTLPATAELRGITPLIDPDVDVDGAVADLSASSAATPLAADGLSVFDLLVEQGLGDLVVSSEGGAGGAAAGGAADNANDNANDNADAGNANDNQNQNDADNNADAGNADNANDNADAGNANDNANDNAGDADVEEEDCEDEEAQGNNDNDNANANDNANDNANNNNQNADDNQNAGNADNANDNADNANDNADNANDNAGNANDNADNANDNAADGEDAAAGGNAGAGGADFGLCTPTIIFEGGLGGRPADEFTFQIADELARGGQGEALNPDIITNALCNQLTNVCEANDEAIAVCEDAAAQVAGGERNKALADQFNELVGFPGAVTNPSGGPEDVDAAAADAKRRVMRSRVFRA